MNTNPTKLVLACDLSLACPAFAVVEVDLANKQLTVLQVTHIKTKSKDSTGQRLYQIYAHVQDILMRYAFDEVVFEKGFNKFAVATQQIQRTVGVMLVLLYLEGYEKITEIAPTSVKKLVSGDGKSSKDKLAESLIPYVGDIRYNTNDESDAVGVAIALSIQKKWIDTIVRPS